MVKQDRSVRTRQTILSAAAKVFEERGYQMATISEILNTAGVTKGALYFHFPSKEDLAQGVIHEQDQLLPVPPRSYKIQELADTVMLHAYRLQTEPMVRAGVRLSLDQQAHGLDRSGPFTYWTEVVRALLDEARIKGELLPHAVPSEAADVLVGSFGGVQAMSQAVCDYQDLLSRASSLLRYVLPSVAVSSVLASVDLTESRGEKIAAELRVRATAPDATVG
ncbi:MULTISPECIES: ScbR family autoregulator-binding transcription factor [unclassified Streptomyces]|uniref:ScbR family autoregulator-binding transcription factor n=1 Tax=unclassified Streptomyces TaxID=2593676 RepID=UPI00344B373F